MCNGIKWLYRLSLIGLLIHSAELISTTKKNEIESENHNSSVEMLWELTNYALQQSRTQGRQRQPPQGSNLGYGGGGYGLSYPDYNQQRPLGYPIQHLPGQHRPLGQYRPPGQFGGPPGYFPNQNNQGSVMEVLDSIASNDELQCVPKLLCELTAGSRYNRQSSSLPFNINMESLLSLVSAFGPSTNPLFHFGKAALLGYTTQGSSCYRTFSRCPTDPDKLVNYLNNYNGGFFRYFQGTPGQNYQGTYYPGQHQYPNYQNQQGQGQYPNNLQQQYLQGQQGQYQNYHQLNLAQQQIQGYFQQPLRQPYNYNVNNQLYGPQQRILTQSLDKYYPYRYANPYSYRDVDNTGDRNRLTSGIRFPDDAYYGQNDIPVDDVFHAKRYKSPKTLTFPGETSATRGYYSRAPKTLTFPHNDLDFQMVRPNHVATPYIFPTRTGTGELILDTQEFNNY